MDWNIQRGGKGRFSTGWSNGKWVGQNNSVQLSCPSEATWGQGAHKTPVLRENNCFWAPSETRLTSCSFLSLRSSPASLMLLLDYSYCVLQQSAVTCLLWPEENTIVFGLLEGKVGKLLSASYATLGARMSILKLLHQVVCLSWLVPQDSCSSLWLIES